MASNKELLAKLSPEQRGLLAKKLAQKKAQQKRSGKAIDSQVKADPDKRFEAFPLTELQQAYWVGRSGAYELGDVAGHSYVEVEADFDLEKLNTAWSLLIERHDMLRAVVSPNGMQRVLPETPTYQIREHDLSDLSPAEQEQKMEVLRFRISHQILDSETWPLFNFEAAILSDQRVRLYLGFDAIIIDGWSLAILLNEWTTLYKNPKTDLIELNLSFRDYVIAERQLKQTPEFERAKSYWQKRLKSMPPGPSLPLATRSGQVQRFFRRHGELDADSYQRLKDSAKQHGITPTVVLLAAYSHVVALWSGNNHFTLSVPQFNRMPLHPQVNSVVGEAASFNLLEVDLQAEHSFIESAKKIQAQLWNDLDHNYFSGVQVLRELSQLNRQAEGILMPVIFTGSPQDPDGNDGFLTTVAAQLGKVVYSINQTPQVRLDNHISEQNGWLSIDWDTVEDIFPAGMQDAMFEAYLQMLGSLAKEESYWQLKRDSTAASLMPSLQWQNRVALQGEKRSIGDELIQDLFARQVENNPNKNAIVTSEKTLTYSGLYESANQWAHRLQDCQVQENSLVAIVMEKGWHQALAAHAVLQSGAAYAPLDANQPSERLFQVLDDSQARVVLTQTWVAKRFDWPKGLIVICVDKEDVSRLSIEPPPRLQTADDLAYVLYTSGSTGKPKGVMIHHRGVVNAIKATLKTFSINDRDSIFGLTALHHDLSIFDIFGITAAGGSLVIPDADKRRDPDHWSIMLKEHSVTLWNSVPAMMDMMLEYAEQHVGSMPKSLRLAFLGGDWIPITLPERLMSQVDSARVVSTGGPTETTLWNIWYPVQSMNSAWSSIPYGTPIDNTSYYVLNEDLQSCPDWVTGELCCAGVGVAKGYWQDQKKTEEKFINHPRSGERLYRTGDLGRYVPDGHIEFIGRKDFQIKIQGQRIESGEVEAALLRHNSISQAIVNFVEHNDRKRLVAYLVANDGMQINSVQLKQYLQSKLPDYMVPQSFMVLDAFPLTANGKVERRLLPAFDDNSVSRKQGTKVKSNIISQLITIAEEVMQLASIQADDNLLALGANSIDMVRIGNQLEKEFGFRPRMDELFRLQTLTALADYCSENSLQADPEEKQSTSGVDGVDDNLKSVIESFEPIRDPALREAFKNSRPGVRREKSDETIQLEKPDDEKLKVEYDKRYSHRRFGLAPVPFSQFSEFLRCLYLMDIGGKPRYLYPSPGGLYPTQVYLHIKPGRVEGVAAGTYYYNPEKHQLMPILKNVEIERSIHVPFVNTPMFDEAAISLFLVTDLAAIAPSYGELSVFFAKLEAGVMAQHIETSAIKCELGICQTGGANFEQIKHLFKLDDNYMFVHSLLAGPIFDKKSGYQVNNEVLNEDPQIRAENLLNRIESLTEKEAEKLLKAQRRIQGDVK